MAIEADDINYEDLDDLALSDHIEWNHSHPEDCYIDPLDDEFGY